MTQWMPKWAMLWPWVRKKVSLWPADSWPADGSVLVLNYCQPCNAIEQLSRTATRLAGIAVNAGQGLIVMGLVGQWVHWMWLHAMSGNCCALNGDHWECQSYLLWSGLNFIQLSVHMTSCVMTDQADRRGLKNHIELSYSTILSS